MIIALIIAILMAGAVYLVLQRGMTRIVLGMTFLSHAANLTIMATCIGAWRGEPFISPENPDPAAVAAAADPLPQSFVLTAIVISLATTAIMLTLASFGRTDDTYVHDPTTDTEAATSGIGERSALDTAGRAQLRARTRTTSHSSTVLRATEAPARSTHATAPTTDTSEKGAR